MSIKTYENKHALVGVEMVSDFDYPLLLILFFLCLCVFMCTDTKTHYKQCMDVRKPSKTINGCASAANLVLEYSNSAVNL